MSLAFVAVIVIGITVFFAAHAYIAIALIRLFPLCAEYAVSVSGLLIFLAFSFPVASIMMHLSESMMTRAMYFCAGLWLGAIVPCIVALTIALGMRRISSAFSSSVFPAALLMIAAAVVMIGVWKAFHPKIREVTASIEGLPEQWQGKRIVQISDVHLGAVYRSDFSQSIVDQINSIHPEAVVITGDLFDGADEHVDGLVVPFSGIRAPYGTFFVTGNHETYLGVARAISAVTAVGIRVLDGEVADLDGLKLIGIGYPERGTADTVLETLQSVSSEFSGYPNILLFHSPTHTEDFRSAGIGLQLSGHTHRGQEFPFNLVTAMIYHGLDYGLHQFGSYSIYTTSGAGTWGPTMRIGTDSEIVVITLIRKD
jgi:uncharacterized protein